MSGRLCWTDGGVAVKTKGLLTALAFVSLALTACAPGVQPLLDEYNALFDSVTLTGGSGGQEEETWLEDYYEPFENDHFSLPVPEHCSDWDWNMSADPGHPEDEMPPDFVIDKYVGDNGHLTIGENGATLQDVGFKPGNYIITCTVTRSGRKIIATCKVLIRSAESLR